MPGNTVNTRRIAQNTIFLYIRMLIIMLVNLYVVREILDILGVVDYGIFNVVGGVVNMFAFLHGTLSSASQRYFSISLTENNVEDIQKQFRLNISLFLLFIVVVVLLAETVGLWFVNTQMSIPDDRVMAANIIYQLSIVSFALTLVSVPYDALIIAHEHMKAFAYIGLVQAIMKLAMVVILALIDFDKLVLYGMLMLLISVAVTLFYYQYCKRSYKYCTYKPYWNSADAKDLVSFSGWHFLGTISVVIRSNGINLLINTFFSPAINAARAIAIQVEALVNQLSGNFFVAAKPQIYKTYAANNITEFIALIFRTTKICVFLVSFLAVPLIINSQFILGLWLKDVPEYAVIFTQLILVNSLIDATSNPTICAALATKKIRCFYLVTGNLYILTLPISYLMLKLGFDATATIFVSILISGVAAIARACILRRLFDFPLYDYLILFVRLFLISAFIVFVNIYIAEYISNSVLVFIITCMISSVLHILMYVIFVLNNSEKDSIFKIIKNKLHSHV